MDIPKEKLQDFAHDELLRFAMDSTANNVYQQNRIEELEAENKNCKKRYTKEVLLNERLRLFLSGVKMDFSEKKTLCNRIDELLADKED